jgi:D-amino-acid oxidase
MLKTRRQIIQGASAATSLLWMPALARRSNAETAAENVGPLRGGQILKTPEFEKLRTNAQFVAGVRPYRKGGVSLSLKEINSAKGTKFLIHNYGHSGAGITLSWGCASVVCDHVQAVVNQTKGSKTKLSVAILGSGVIGLTVATELRRKWPGLPMTVYAKTLDVTKTTSYIAGGQFEPSQIYDEYMGDKKPILEDYLRRSAARIKGIQDSGHRTDFGVAQRKNYTLDNPQPAFDDYTPHDVVPAFNTGKLPFKQLNVVGREYSTWLMNPQILLPKLVADLKKGSVQFKATEFTDQQQVEDMNENIIINCTGYGAKKLFADDAVKPRRGLLAFLKNPDQLTYFFSGGCKDAEIAYLFARQSDMVIGGTLTHDDADYSDDKDKASCNQLINNIQLVFDGQPEACKDPLKVA